MRSQLGSGSGFPRAELEFVFDESSRIRIASSSCSRTAPD